MTLKALFKRFKQHKKLSLLLLISSLTGFYYFHQQQKGNPNQAVKVVETAILTPDKIQKTVKLIGTIRPKHSTLLVAKVNGLLDILLNAGDEVKKGDLIAEINNPEIARNYELAQAEERIAKTQYERLQKVGNKGIVSAREVEEKKQAWLEAQRDLAKSRIELNNLRFYAPFDGILGAYKQREGAQVAIGDAVVTVYDPTSLSVDLDIPCSNLHKIKTNQKVKVFGKAYPLTHIQKMVDEDSQMCPANVDIECKDCLIGSSVLVELIVKEKSNIMVVPAEALFIRNGKNFVYTLQNNHVTLAPVVPGLEGKNKIEIRSGLKAGDQVIVRGYERLFPGLAVEVYQPNQANELTG